MLIYQVEELVIILVRNKIFAGSLSHAGNGCRASISIR
jgi:hypothetical protein